MKKEEKIIKVLWKVYAYEMHYLWNKYNDWEVVQVICPAFDIDEEMMLEDMPELLETNIETLLEKKQKDFTKKRVTLWLYNKDIKFYKQIAKERWLPYQQVIREAVSQK